MYFTKIFRSWSKAQGLDIYMNCGGNTFFIFPSYHSFSGVGGMIAALSFTWSCWGLTMRMCHHSGPGTLDRPIRCHSRDFPHWNGGERWRPWGRSWEDKGPGTADSLDSSLKENVRYGEWNCVWREAKQGLENGKTLSEHQTLLHISTYHFFNPHKKFYEQGHLMSKPIWCLCDFFLKLSVPSGRESPVPGCRRWLGFSPHLPLSRYLLVAMERVKHMISILCVRDLRFPNIM